MLVREPKVGYSSDKQTLDRLYVLRQLFGQRLKQLRKQRRISQERLAEAVGVAPYTIRRWEHAIDAPEFDRLEIIAEALGVEAKDLLDFSSLPKIEE